MIKRVTTTKKKLTINSIVSNNNRRRQESFDSIDMKYLSKKSEVKVGKKLGAGSYGSFHLITGNKRLGVKIPHCPAGKDCDYDICEQCTDKENILDELELCNTHNYNDRSFLSPSHAITVDRKGRKCIGIARPLITPISWRNAHLFNDGQLESVRVALISLAKDGIGLKDGVQCGFTTSGRILQFDLGDVKKFSVDIAFGYNSRAWNTLLSDAQKLKACDELPTHSAWVECSRKVKAKYGDVEP